MKRNWYEYIIWVVALVFFFSTILAKVKNETRTTAQYTTSKNLTVNKVDSTTHEMATAVFCSKLEKVLKT
jgi:hypothetical protein